MMKLRWLMLACAAGWSWQGRALACSVILPTKQSVECADGADARAHTAVAQLRLELDSVEIQRSRYAPPGQGDCGELGSTRLSFHLAGASAWPSDVGLLLTLREGQSGYFAPPLTTVGDTSGWLLLPQAGVVRLFGPDDPGAPLALRLEARALDCSGALSAPVEVLIAHPGWGDAGAPQAPVSVEPEGVAGAGGTTEVVQASRSAPVGASCAVCSVQGKGSGSERPGLALVLGLLALSGLRRRRR